MRTVCDKNQCTGCMACIDSCAKSAISILDTLNAYNAVIDETKCVNCGACMHVCQKVTPIPLKAPIAWHQGWTKNKAIRQRSSSGGFATGIATSFINEGGYVASCVFRDGIFGFKLTNSVKDVQQFTGSRYIKSNPVGIYKQIRTKLTEGSKVLFIALPCQVAALKKYVGEKVENQLYTIDLICHGSPSPKVLDNFLLQYGLQLNKLEDVQFRVKDHFQVFENYKGIVTSGVRDAYLTAFLNGLIYTENCYECAYATFNRCSDLTLGDSWGSDLSQDEKKQGISLVLCQTEKGKYLLDIAELNLKAVNIENAIANNHQLSSPSAKPDYYTEFFEKLNSGKRFNSLIRKYYPKQCLKQDIKAVLIKLNILRGGGYTIIYKLKSNTN